MENSKEERIYISAPTGVGDWVDIAYKINETSAYSIVGHHTGVKNENYKKVADWHVFDCKQAKHKYLRNNTNESVNTTLSKRLWRANKQVFKGLLNRRVWFILRSEAKKVFFYFCKLWQRIINDVKPSAIIFCVSPHTGYDYPLYLIAKEFNIDTLIFTPISYTPYTYIRESLFFEEEVKRLSKSFNDISASNIVDKVLKRCKGDYDNNMPKEVEKLWSKPKTYSIPRLSQFDGWLFSSIKRPDVIAEYAKEKINHFIKWDNLRKECKSISESPDYSERYIYYPLHFQPERTTAPEGGEHHDQIQFARYVAAHLPPDNCLYIKEHPSQFKSQGGWMGRHIGYYEELSRIDKVKLVSVDSDQFRLIDNSCKVVTITGTSAIEAISRGTPAGIAGYPWFYPGIRYHIASPEKLKSFLKLSCENVSIIQEYLHNFLRSIPDFAVKGYTEGSDPQKDKISRDENVSCISEYILEYLSST